MVPAWMALLGLLWGCDGDCRQPPTAFLILVESVENITGLRRALVAGVASGTCDAVPGAQPDDFCATLACPGPGRFRVTVEARAYQTRSNTIEFRVRDAACTQVEGLLPSPGAAWAGIPAVTHCQPPTVVPPPAPVHVQVPSQETVTVIIPQPHTTAPVIPVNPDVVPKQPHAAGSLDLAALLASLLQRPVAQPTATVPPPRTMTVATGPPTTIQVQQPPVTQPGVPCP